MLGIGALVACGGGSDDNTSGTPEASSQIIMVNETPCVLHFRFDNGPPKGRVQPGTSLTYDDPIVAASRFVKFESTRAIFRTFDMAAIREDGNQITVRPAADDNPCAETEAE